MRRRAEHLFEPSDGVDEHVIELWCWYYDETESFDRAICTGPIIDGAIMPASAEQRSAIFANALATLKEVESYVLRMVNPLRSQDLRNVACDRMRRGR